MFSQGVYFCFYSCAAIVDGAVMNAGLVSCFLRTSFRDLRMDTTGLGDGLLAFCRWGLVMRVVDLGLHPCTTSDAFWLGISRRRLLACTAWHICTETTTNDRESLIDDFFGFQHGR